MEDTLGVKCTFETDCAWTWEEKKIDGFQVVTGVNLTNANRTGLMPGPIADYENNANGHFLHLRTIPSTGQRMLRSPTFSTTLENCMLEVLIHQSAMSTGSFRIVLQPLEKEAPWVIHEMVGNDSNDWQNFTFMIDRISKDFQLLFEVVPGPNLDGHQRGHVSIDNLRMKNCFPDIAIGDNCDAMQVKCKTSKITKCIIPSRICDITQDCDDNEDELYNCDKIPYGGRCDFEKDDWCGWENSGRAIMLWSKHRGPTPTATTGPDLDHTFQNMNASGHFMFVNMNQHFNDSEKKKLVGFASNAVMNSVIFNPPPSVNSNISSPYRNSCMVRFYVHQFGLNAGSINLSVVAVSEKENITTTLWWSSKNLGKDWIRVQLELPNITTRYFLQLEARMGMRIFSDVAIDDFSMSPECFGLNIPKSQLDGYDYWNPKNSIHKETHKDFAEKSIIKLSTCGAKGTFGPNQSDCIEAYNGTDAMNSVRVLEKKPFRGIQVWKVPNEGYYT